MRHLFGPVPSRRLGASLGIDLIPYKTCPFDCIYCECGATTNLRTERSVFVPTGSILEELSHYLDSHPAPDYVTYGGSGEPLLAANIGELISVVRQRWPKQKQALLTNSALLRDKALHQELLPLDLVLPSLDAALQEPFVRINRPQSGLHIDQIIAGLCAFRRVFQGTIWLEIFVVPGVNDTPQSLEAFRRTLPQTGADQIQLNALDRPGSEDWVRQASGEELAKFREQLGLENVTIVSRAFRTTAEQSAIAALEERILATVSRRPCTLADLATVCGTGMGDIAPTVEQLLAQGRLVCRTSGGAEFYTRPSRSAAP